jgi:hypothetical protein
VRSITRNKKNAKSETGGYDRKAKLKSKTSPKNNKIKTKNYKKGGDPSPQNKLQEDYKLAKQKTKGLIVTFTNLFSLDRFITLKSDFQKKRS